MSKVKKVGGIALLTMVSFTANTATAATPYDGVYLTDNGEKVDWQQLARSGQVKYVLIKATEGDDEVSQNYKSQLAEAKKCGLKVGSYHVLRSSSSTDAQFENFKSVVDRNSQDIIPVVAVELIGGLSANKLVENVKEFAKKVESYYGCVPMISTSSSFYNKYLSGSGLSCPLMISSYGNEEPELSDGAEWWMWECSDDEQVAGCNDPLVVTRLASDRSLGDFALNHRSEPKAPKNAEVKKPELAKPAHATAAASVVSDKPERKKDYTRHPVTVAVESQTNKKPKPIKNDKATRGVKNENAAKEAKAEVEIPETQEVDFQSPSKFSSVIYQRHAKAEKERQKKEEERLKKEKEREKKLKKEQEKARKQAEKEEKARLKKEKQQKDAELKHKRDVANANSEREQRIKEAKARNEQLQKNKKEAEPKTAAIEQSAETSNVAAPSSRSTRRIRKKSKVASSDSVKVRERIYEVDDEKMKQPVRNKKKKK